MTKEQFLALLPSLGFTKRGGLFVKEFGNARLAVDVKNETLCYPEDQGLVVNERQTCNFKQPENFVVFECVHRLLEKGYTANHLELEPKWKLGHGASGGRADILIKDNAGRALLIIECKTAGREFDKAWRDTIHDGGQLFSYTQQISETQFLCLYASEPNDDGTAVRYRSHIVAHRDNEKYLAENPTLKGFKHATDVRSRFAVWRDTYKLDFRTAGIFEANIQPYHIGKDKYSLADLHPISADDQQKKYHEFATILRQHNVSGRENAFDKLVNLFLCKLVDESQHPDDLKFYWKGVAYDTHFQLLDRLQQLYQAGMEKFLGEKITYIAESDVSAALRFVRHNPDATQRAVWNLFIQQKFFTNNDFSFIDVHNEKLFYQNAEVLLKILQMWQDIRLAAPDAHNQFLGDMFEFFLDQGVKQSEGQFFTPGPICRFLLMSLPLEAMVKKDAVPPKAVDYACGAGHFLTELARQLKPLVEKHHPAARVDDYHAAILGIEKEYRLSKIAKVSAFMYGQPRIKICYGDALIAEHEAFPEIADGTFDLLVANPPFSVRGFLETLPEREQERYELTQTIDKQDTANSIETFFLERARQLLKPGGVAGVFFPSSLLSNGGTTYVRARALLLRSFDIVAIAEFGSGTFGRTGTNTVILFLRRKASGPETAEHFEGRVAEWFKGADNDKRKQVTYKDEHLIDRYATHIGASAADYKTLLCGTPNAALLAHETFVAYRRAFDANSETRGLATKVWFKKLTPEEKDAELAKRFLAFVQAIERDKLLHFAIADLQPGPVLIMRCPTDTKEQKRFLGYEWSGAKGGEGIHIFRDADKRHVTPLYDEADRDNPAKINHSIARHFEGKLGAIPAGLENHCSLVPLAELLDFSRADFEKQIVLHGKTSVAVQSKWPLEPMGTVAEVLIGGTPARGNRAFYEGSNPWVSIAEMRGQVITDTKEKITDAAVAKSNVKLIPKGTTLLSFKLSIGKTAIAGCDLYTNEAIAGLIPRDRSKLLDAFLFHLFDAKHIDLTGSGYKAFGKSLNSAFLRDDVKLPVPPLDIQSAIVAECEVVDAEAAKVQAAIQEAQGNIERLLQNSTGQLKRLSELTSKIGSGATPLGGEATYKETGIPFIRSQNVHDDGFKITGLAHLDDAQAAELDYVTVATGDVLFNITGASVARCCVADPDYLPARVNQHVAILRPTKGILPKFLQLALVSPRSKAALLEIAGGSATRQAITKSQLEDFKVPVPPLKEQERFVKEIEALESKITAARAILRDTPARKEAILKKHL